MIRLEKSQLGDPMTLVGTIAHELSHARLLGENRIRRDVYDHEITTDLGAVILGCGIFLANVPRNWEGDNRRWPGTDLIKPEYMTPPMYGYALAHVAWFRGERKPSWRKHLSFGARANLDEGLRFLWDTGDSLFRPNRLVG